MGVDENKKWNDTQHDRWSKTHTTAYYFTQINYEAIKADTPKCLQPVWRFAGRFRMMFDICYL